MCGIAGIVGRPEPELSALTVMATAMAHRGPDAQGVWCGDHAGLAFRRLAIIDLDERSNQPMHLGHLHLVFNGEIYNYKELRRQLTGAGHVFATEGDGEVLLHAWDEWGEQALQRLNGMFACAVWDGKSRVLTAACDPFGEKPLFWSETDGTLLFGSDIRALLRVAPSLAAAREGALGPYLARGLMPRIDQSFFADVNRLPGGHLLRWTPQAARVERWWTPTRVEPPRRYEDAVDELRELLLDSVRLRLRSDVPVGSSLSGGVDSSAVISLMARVDSNAVRHAFTATFPGFERDEWRFASAAADHVGLAEHHAVRPDGEELLSELEQLVASHEEPVGSSSVYAQYRVMRAARVAGVSVLLDGQGADELFGGYRGVAGWAARSGGPAEVARALLRGGQHAEDVLLSFGSERMPIGLAARHRLKSSSPYATQEVAWTAARIGVPEVDWARRRGPLTRELARQAVHTSLPALLRYADRNSMAHSRELRLPFLDRRIAELAFSLPADFVYRHGTTKSLLKDAVRDLVAPAVLKPRPKVGFETPERDWLTRPETMRWIGDVLLDPGCRCAALLDVPAIQSDLRRGAWRDFNGAWRALNLELWLRAFTARTSDAPGRRSDWEAARV